MHKKTRWLVPQSPPHLFVFYHNSWRSADSDTASLAQTLRPGCSLDAAKIPTSTGIHVLSAHSLAVAVFVGSIVILLMQQDVRMTAGTPDSRAYVHHVHVAMHVVAILVRYT